jgi:hypothetical protein
MLLRVGARAGSDVGHEDNFDGACDINLDELLPVTPEVTFGCIPVLAGTPMCTDSCWVLISMSQEFVDDAEH